MYILNVNRHGQRHHFETANNYMHIYIVWTLNLLTFDETRAERCHSNLDAHIANECIIPAAYSKFFIKSRHKGIYSNPIYSYRLSD
jgi:hypothetical protein